MPARVAKPDVVFDEGSGSISTSCFALGSTAPSVGAVELIVLFPMLSLILIVECPFLLVVGLIRRSEWEPDQNRPVDLIRLRNLKEYLLGGFLEVGPVEDDDTIGAGS